MTPPAQSTSSRTEVDDFSGPHPGPREQQHDCRVPQWLKRRSVGRALDEPIHIVARQARWKRRVTPSPDPWQRFLSRPDDTRPPHAEIT
jgi:hypothetical protein